MPQSMGNCRLETPPAVCEPQSTAACSRRMHALLCGAPAKLCSAAAAALLLLALPLLPQQRTSWRCLCSGCDGCYAASQTATAANSTLGGGTVATAVAGRVDVLIPYSPDDRAVFLTDDPGRGALASVLRYVSDLRTVFIVANAASRAELQPVLRDGRVVYVDEDSVLPKPADLRGWHYQQVCPADDLHSCRPSILHMLSGHHSAFAVS